jgi:hypothetical protein
MFDDTIITINGTEYIRKDTVEEKEEEIELDALIILEALKEGGLTIDEVTSALQDYLEEKHSDGVYNVDSYDVTRKGDGDAKELVLLSVLYNIFH